MAEQETDAVRELLTRLEKAHRHVEADEPGCDDFCGLDFEYWPCRTVRLIAAVRAVLDLADSHAGCCQAVHVDRLRAAVVAHALPPDQGDTDE